MNRTFPAIVVLCGTSSLLLVDSAIKGFLILLSAAFAAMLLRRDSAATRHLVWLVAIVAMLTIPVFSALLPQWQVLPAWIGLSHESPAMDVPIPAAAVPQQVTVADPVDVVSVASGVPSASDNPPGAVAVVAQPEFVASEVLPEPIETSWSRSWVNTLPLFWAIGFCLLILRLLIARWVLWNNERRGTVISLSPHASVAGTAQEAQSNAAIVTTTQAVCQQLGVRQPIRLLIHAERTIPVVWGIVRFRLLLPEAARYWSEELLRSVLLHEVAHLKRRDTVVQLLAQIACALHWFNPLVWFAAWRLHVERERACDDLVLSNGVRASAYAEHLLNVATKLSPDCWTAACGLTMASNLRLHGRLQAILSDRLNRRKVSTTIGALALLLGTSIAVPIAMLRAAADENHAEPKDAMSKTLFESWKTSARSDGKIPGGRIGEMAASLKTYMDLNAGTEAAARCEAVFKKCDATHDWTTADAAALLDEIEAVAPSRAKWAMRTNIERTIQPGKPLPEEFKDAPWGQPAANGLRIAWLLEPRAETHPLDSVMKSRVLFHNTGKAPVCFATEDWIQTGGHKAKEANGKEISVWAVDRMGIRTRMVFRLAPGEYAEVEGHGIGVGSHETSSEKSIYKVGCWIEAKEGDVVTFTPGKVLVSFQTWQNNEGRKDSETVWNEMIAARVAQEGPVPATVADRDLLLKRVTQDLGIAAPYYSSRIDFEHDDSPDALATLTAKLQAAGKSMHFAGELSGGETKFRVTAAESQQETTEEEAFTAWGEELAGLQAGVGFYPGEKRAYSHGETVRLAIRVRNVGAKELKFQYLRQFFAETPPAVTDGEGKPVPLEGLPTAFGIHIPREVKLQPGKEFELYELQLRPRPASEVGVAPSPKEGSEALVQRIWASGKVSVQYGRIFGDSSSGQLKPDPALSELATGKLELEIEPATQVQQQNSQRPKGGAQLKPATEQKLKWGEAVNGLRMALAWPPTLGEPGMGDAEEFFLVVQNVSETAVRLATGDDAPNPRRLMMRENGRPLQAISDPAPTPGDWLLQPREVAFLRLYRSNAEWKDGRTISSAIEKDIRTVPRCSMTADMTIEKAPPGAWTGRLKTGETRGSVDVIPPKHKDAQALYQSWTTAGRIDGKIPGALIGLLAESVKVFIKNNPTWETTPQLEKMLPRFDFSHDWVGQDAVALLDQLAAVQDTPIKTALDREEQGVIRTGSPLPPELADAPWGETLSNGLRHAWLLEPRTAEHRLGTPLKARVLIHNAGKEPVVFRTRTWHQLGHKATDANGAEIKTESTSWTTRGLLLTYRLGPGEFIEVKGPGIGVGPIGNPEDWQQTRVGAWIEAQAGDEVTVTTAPLPLYDWGEEEQLKLDGEPRWWLDYIQARLSRHLPFPADKDARERLLYPVAMELFGTPYNDAAFVADTTPGALDALVVRLFHRPGQNSWAGPLESAPTKFRVLPADPDAAKKPRTANGPGEYTLNENAMLVVKRRPIGERIVNEAHIVFYSPDEKKPKTGEDYQINLPDDYNTWAAAWVRGGTVMWLRQKGLLRKIDFSQFAKAEETRYEGDKGADAPIPAHIREALRAALEVPAAPRQIEKPLPPAAPASVAPASEAPKPDKAKEGADAGRPLHEKLDEINEKIAALRAERKKLLEPLNAGHPDARDIDEKIQEYERDFRKAVGVGSNQSKSGKEGPDARLPKGAQAKITPEALLGFWRGTLNGEAISISFSFHRPPVDANVQCNIYFGEATIGAPTSFKVAPDGKSVMLMRRGKGGGEYGRLTPGEAGTLQLELTDGSSKPGKTVLTREADEPSNVPRQKEPRALFALWQKSALPDGKIPGALIGRLAEAVKAYVKANPNYDSSDKLPKLLPRFDASHDWAPADVVSLLDDVAYYSTDPIEALMPKGADAVQFPDAQYAKDGLPLEDLNGEGVMWNGEESGLSLGYRITGDEWRILGKELKVELWVRNAGKDDVKFQILRRTDEGLRVKLKGKDGETHVATRAPNDIPLIGIKHLLSPGQCTAALDRRRHAGAASGSPCGN